jgi:NADPH:quinone reductase-like Zn-dependent oxidoreductase
LDPREAIVRAAFVTQPGTAESIVVGEFRDPAGGATDVLVRVTATTVNQVDTYIRSGVYRTRLPLPFIVGRDLVGVVEQAGPGAAFEPGEKVWSNSLGHGGRQGPTAELAAVPADRLYRLPDDVDPLVAVVALHPAATAFLALHRRAIVQAGQSIFIGGGAGSIGSAAVQFARAAGLRVIASASPRDADLVASLGASTVLDYQDADLVASVRRVEPEGVDIFWDTSGHAQLSEVADALAERGQVIVTAGRQRQDDLHLWPYYTRDIRITGFVISLATAPELAAAAKAVNARLVEGGFAMRTGAVLPLDRTAEAHRLVETGRVNGRVAIVVAA